ncbi:zinc finger protein 609 isoform X2 [Oenanthe melanoleuca]|uniref:zinc finger protein 609 isoform X2 n=1 Tax=Oenanthe melanoleuca TaxID=2939378 RepID=UPI0024C1CFC0|nr:zinc finger protein 609 isoform X2 [Oenanthe melanoleuca]XP_056355440.1 zinc finger protein 609 isoform X2 [Oenanthe melanoleuca]
MSLSSGASGGKGIDANPVETYDSGDEWDIGVGNLIIDLDADLEKDQQKLEMSGSKEVGLPAPNAVATLPDNIKFVSPVPGPQGKEGKSKSKRSKTGKDSGKLTPGSSLFTPGEGAGGKKEVQGRSGDGVNSGGLVPAVTPKSSEKSAKASRSVAGSKKEKESGSSKSKKERSEGAGASAEKEPSVLQPLALAVRVGQYDGGQGTEPAAAEQLGSIAIDTGAALNPLGVKSELEDGESECRQLKKMESPVSTPAVLPLHLLVPVVNNDISSPCEQIMVRTRSVGVNTCDVALATEPECLGPCEPGTSVNLEGIVWQETEDGMLVVNVTWRNKTYVGTLLDCTQHDWAPPRFCDSPTSDLEMRNGRGRGKRMRPNSNTPVNETATASDSKGTSSSSKTRAGANSKGRRGSQNSSDHRTPPGGTSEDVKASPSSVTKRKSKPLSDMDLNSSSEDSKGSKRIRTNSMGSATVPPATVKVEPAVLERNCPSPILIDCPHPNCNKKYKHINGLKYHQAHAHTDDDSKLEADVDSEYGEEPSLHADVGSCNGAAGTQKGSLSPARSATPKVRLMEPHSPSPSSKFSAKVPCKKKVGGGEGDTDLGALSNDGSEDGPLVADETSNDDFDSLEKRCIDKDKSKKASGAKQEKIPSKSLKSARPIAPAIPPQPIYTFQTATLTTASPGSSTGLATTVVQTMPNSPQLKPIQPKPTVMGEPFTVNPALTPSKEKKKKDKKKKEPKEVENPLTPGKACRAEEGKSPFRGESSELGMKGEGLLNGSSDPHQSRLASIKAEADKIYSFTDNAPSPSIGGASRLENTNPAQALTPLHVVTQNGAEASSVKTNSPAYSDISDAGEDGEGKLESVKAKDPEQLVKEGAKKALFPPQPQSKESPFYQGFETYYSPGYPQASPGPLNPGGQSAAETQTLKLKKDEEQENPEVKVKSEGCEEKKAELSSGSSQQPSVIQQRPNMYMQSLYYNQYAYVPPYGYSEQGYHTHLLSTNSAYRQQYEEQQKQRQSLEQQQQRGLDKKAELGLKEREVALKEEWKQKPPMPPTLTKAPSLTDLVKSGLSKPKEQGGPDMAKSVIIPKLEDSSKLSSSQVAEGLKVKLSEAGHLGKETAETKAGSECGRQAEVDPVLWYRQEAEPRMWTYVYPAKYSDIKTEDERWKEERDRKLKEERNRSKEASSKEEGKESSSSECKLTPGEEARMVGKEPRPSVHVPVSSPLTQHQSYIPYMHGYSYSQSYDPNHPSYRAMPTVMMQNYPGSYLPSSYSFSPYGSKASGSDDSDKSRASPSVSCKSSSESKALDILQQHASHYKSKSPTISEKTSQERERSGCGVVGGGGNCSSVGGAAAGDRSSDRPRTSPSQRLLSTHHHHHHLGYSLLPAQYNLPYATGLSSTAIVASQQGSAPSLYPPPRR